MPINIKNILKLRLNKLGIDAQDGTAVGDLLVNPLSYILNEYDITNNSLIEKFSKIDINSLNESEMDILAASFLIKRLAGSKASGYVNFYYSEPVTASIAKGAVITNGDLRYEITDNFTIVPGTLIYQAPYYVSRDIPILAVENGANYNLAINSNFEIEGYTTKSPVKITNSTEIVNGVDNETNEDLYIRIQNSLFGNFLSSPTNIENYIKEKNPDVVSVEIVGYDNPLMTRDYVYDVSDDSNYNKETYRYVKPGLIDNNYDKPHKAKYGLFADLDSSASGVSFPTSPTAWSKEFTSEMYKGLYKDSDLLYAKTDEEAVLTYFTSSSPLSTLTLDGDSSKLIQDGWNLKDGSSTDNELDYPKLVVLEGASLRLGVTRIDPDVYVTKDLVEQYADEYTNSTTNLTWEEWINELWDTFDWYDANNKSPVVTTTIDQHTGIKINFSMLTTDKSELGSTSYATVFKNNLLFSPYDGFGLAWKKQPAYLLRINKNNYGTNVAQKEKDLEQFYNEFQVDGTTFLGNLSNPTNSAYWKYNLFVVDNNILEDEVWVSSDQVWNQSSGRDQFLSSAKMWIENDVEYYVIMEISEKMGIKVWIDTSSPNTTNTPNISFGPFSPDYIPDASNPISVGSKQAYRNQFGFGVVNTHNYEWKYRNLNIASIITSFPAHLFSLDLSAFNTSHGFTWKYNGMAFDPTKGLGETGYSEVKVGVWKHSTGSWYTTTGMVNSKEPPTVTGSYVKTDYDLTGSLTPLSDYVDSSNILYIAAIANKENNNLNELRSYYVEVNDNVYTGVHRGNAVDIYVHDPKNIVKGEVEYIITNTEIDFTNNSAMNGWIQEIVEISEAYSGITIPETGWSVMNSVRSRGEEFSVHNKFKVTFNNTSYNNTKVRIKYRYWANGESTNFYINDDEVRQPAVDYMLKVMPPTIIIIDSLNYSGNISNNEVLIKIKDFINNLNKTFDKVDLINYLYSLGITYVDLNMTIRLKVYDSEMTVVYKNLNEQTYTIPVNTVSRFYTTDDYLIGVTKL